MKKLKLLWSIFKTTNADKIIIGFLGFVLFVSLVFTIIEPSIANYFDALWYSFAVVTTIGFGDLVAVTLVGRGVTILLGIYGLLVVALIPGIVVSFYMEASKIRAKESAEKFIEKLENLPTLSKEELEEISAAVKSRKFKM